MPLDASGGVHDGPQPRHPAQRVRVEDRTAPSGEQHLGVGEPGPEYGAGPREVGEQELGLHIGDPDQLGQSPAAENGRPGVRTHREHGGGPGGDGGSGQSVLSCGGTRTPEALEAAGRERGGSRTMLTEPGGPGAATRGTGRRGSPAGPIRPGPVSGAAWLPDRVGPRPTGAGAGPGAPAGAHSGVVWVTHHSRRGRAPSSKGWTSRRVQPSARASTSPRGKKWTANPPCSQMPSPWKVPAR